VNYDVAGGLKHLLKNASANNCALPPLTAVAGFGGN
jgi:hypothetical protein